MLVLTGHVLKDTAYAARYHTSQAEFSNPVTRADSDEALHALIESLGAVHA